MIRFNCASCGSGVRVGDDKAGKKGKCPQCGQVIVIPAADAPKQTEPPAARRVQARSAASEDDSASLSAPLDGLLSEAISRDLQGRAAPARRLCGVCRSEVPLRADICPRCGALLSGPKGAVQDGPLGPSGRLSRRVLPGRGAAGDPHPPFRRGPPVAGPGAVRLAADRLARRSRRPRTRPAGLLETPRTQTIRIPAWLRCFGGRVA